MVIMGKALDALMHIKMIKGTLIESGKAALTHVDTKSITIPAYITA